MLHAEFPAGEAWLDRDHHQYLTYVFHLDQWLILVVDRGANSVCRDLPLRVSIRMELEARHAERRTDEARKLHGRGDYRDIERA